MIKTIIFDLDGLLVDSLPLMYKAYNQVFTKYGHPISKESWIAHIQGSGKIPEFMKKNGIPGDPEVIREEKKVIYENLINNELELKPGARELVGLLSQDYDLCVASASRMESIRQYLAKFNLTHKFKAVISDYGVKQHKPAPDVFLAAAKEMNALPSECMVIEDSFAGLKAAKAANMKCIICPDSYCEIDKTRFVEADAIVDSLAEVTSKMIQE